MKKTPNPNRGKIIDIILSNTIYATTSVKNQMYHIGKNEAHITVQCDKSGKVLSAFCKYGTQYIVFNDPEDALFVSNACKQRLAAQTREQQKIDTFNKRFR